MPDHHIPIIDLFAGPGGLGEGFSAFQSRNDDIRFQIVLSIEMDHWAHHTLSLRSFFHHFPRGKAPNAYYEHLRGEITREDLVTRFPKAAAAAFQCAWRAELGRVDHEEVDRRIRAALASRKQWVLCGGPPCQAFSVVGRSRTGGISETDHRVYLYLQYLRILAVHEPPLFIMENVKGLLSSQVKGGEFFEQMLADLRFPSSVIRAPKNAGRKSSGATYSLYSLVSREDDDADYVGDPARFLVKSEDYGIPQSRHRVIILGVRDDVSCPHIPILEPHPAQIPVRAVLRGLPRLRSGLTRCEDGQEQWRSVLAEMKDLNFMRSQRTGSEQLIRQRVREMLASDREFKADRGAEFVACQPSSDYRPEWFLDPAIGGVCNHATRPHMASDLHRYLFAAAYAKVHGRSPDLRDFPAELHPDHKNLNDALKRGHFDDRFRVQLAGRPATTITCHLAKDGHYFIHYDDTQCRSLTVREAARIQTFPDNYFFCGPRTHQYRQVGNAVPPLLAEQIAALSARVFSQSGRRVVTSQSSRSSQKRMAANG